MNNLNNISNLNTSLTSDRYYDYEPEKLSSGNDIVVL